MQILKSVNDLFEYIFYVCYIVLYYVSLKKCFLREGYSKAKLFFLALITNPFFMFLFSTIISALIVYINEWSKLGFQNIDAMNNISLDTDPVFSSIIVFIGTIIFLLASFLISYLLGRSLKAYNKSMVMFVYVMFSVIIMLTDNRNYDVSDNSEIFSKILSNFNNIACVIIMFLLYFFIMRAVAKLSDRKRHVNWRMFLITPLMFIVVYSVLDFYTSQFCSVDANSITHILSYIFFVLFIWAFYIIINNIKATDDAINAKEEVKILSVEVMEALAHTIDAKDEYTRGHSVRVAKYSRMLAEKLGLSSEECDNVYYMALLHDIGKIGVPNEIINSTSRLTDDEYAVIKTHPGLGYDILAEIKSRPDLSIGARWHHERYDGKGYPDGKKGEEIPFYARIIAVADSYDAMTSNRSYRNYMPQDKVRSEIENNSGTQFDPDVAKCMLSVIDQDVNYELHE